MNPLRWRLLFIAVVTLVAAYIVAPSFIYFAAPKDVRNSTEEMASRIPKFFPQKHMSLGLDLQGGVQLVLGVNTTTAVENKLSRIGTEAQRWSDDNKAGVAKAYVPKGQQALRIEVQPGTDANELKTKLQKEFTGLKQSGRTDTSFDLQYEEDEIRRVRTSSVDQAERVIRNRIDKWGVSEPVINRRQADNSILVQLPGFKDPSKARELLGRTAQLKFKLVDDKFVGFDKAVDLPAGITKGNNGGQSAFVGEDRDALLAFSKTFVPDDRQLFLQREEIAGGKKNRYTTFVVEASTEISGEDVLDSFVTQNSDGLDQRPEVSMKFTGPGGKRFGDVTGANINRRLAIVLDDIVESAPNIQSKIATGEARITLGTGTGYDKLFQEAQSLATILKSGALPATIEVLEERQVGATLGPELADQGVLAALAGLAAVLIYMLIYYKRPGAIACVALTMNGAFLLAIMASLGFSLSLPGIAGFILTLGMAVDANVLINERIRQELSEGKSSRKAVDIGFAKVFWTIFDANVTTLIAALVLLETNSSGPIRGFAITLIVGLLVSMFTSLYCTKTFFELALTKTRSEKDLRKWLGGAGVDNFKVFKIDFFKLAKPATLAAVVFILATIGSGAIRGVNWGVDFAGGTEMQVRFASSVTPDALEETGRSVGIRSMTMQSIGDGDKNYLMRFGAEDIEPKADGEVTSADQSAKVQELRQAVTTKLADKQPEILSVDFVGPQIGKELRNQGLLSLVYAILGILLYIGLRFDLRFGPGAVVKMIHDVLIALAFYILFKRSIDMTTVAAFLTVIGYSVNDVIVIYDRIRENLVLHARRPLAENINASLNETLTRSINTSVVTIVSLLGLVIFGSGSIWNFAVAMVIGVVAATFSSTFIASFSVLYTERYLKLRAKKALLPNTPAPARG